MEREDKRRMTERKKERERERKREERERKEWEMWRMKEREEKEVGLEDLYILFETIQILFSSYIIGMLVSAIHTIYRLAHISAGL